MCPWQYKCPPVDTPQQLDFLSSSTPMFNHVLIIKAKIRDRQGSQTTTTKIEKSHPKAREQANQKKRKKKMEITFFWFNVDAIWTALRIGWGTQVSPPVLHFCKILTQVLPQKTLPEYFCVSHWLGFHFAFGFLPNKNWNVENKEKEFGWITIVFVHFCLNYSTV